jgi:glycosyltransferase involved in cell wall biosynthesis
MVFAAEEDFGITLVEAQACGTPVIAYGRGGALETVVDSADVGTRTGMFFPAQTVDAIRAAVERFETTGTFNPNVCRRNAERFAPERFRTDLAEFVARVVRERRL